MILIAMFTVIGLALLGTLGVWLLGRRGYVVAAEWRAGMQRVGGYLLKPSLFYHPGHTWAMPREDGTVRVGIDDFGRRIVGGVCHVELPAEGSEVSEGQVAIEMECGRRKRVRLLSPVNGKVVAVNENLALGGLAPEMERDPYGEGWLYAVRPKDQGFTRLVTGSRAVEWMKSEIDRLGMFLHGELGVTAADGGELIPRPPARLEEEQWEGLTRSFFHTSAMTEAGWEEEKEGRIGLATRDTGA